jgi:hypothetical protein
MAGSCALEDEIFFCMADQPALGLIARAIELLDQPLVDEHIRSASNGQTALAQCVAPLSPELRAVLGAAARSKRGSWFKSVTKMEGVARDIVFPNLHTSDATFQATLAAIEQWMFHGA